MARAIRTHTINRRAVMLRAWELFRSQYNYPRVPFNSIGRKCFGWCLREANRERRVHLAAAPVSREAVETRKVNIRNEIEMTRYLPGHMSARRRVAALETEYQALGVAA